MKRQTNGYAARIMAAALATTLLALAGCAGTTEQAKPEEEPTDIVWPSPPEQPRIKYLRSLYSSEDVGAGASTSLVSTLLGESQEAVQKMEKPYAVSADSNGRVFVGETALGRVLVFDAANKKFEVWGQSGPGGLKQPLGVAVDGQGRVYVSDGIQKRVVVFDQDGKFVLAAGKKGELERPVGIAVDETRDRIYVVDTPRHRIAVFDMAGNLVSTIGERGTEPGQFNFPSNMAIDRSGKLYVVDAMNFRVQILDPDGAPLAAFGKNGDMPGNFVRPKGIGVDQDGHIYVVDAAFNNFQVFNSEGALMLIVGGSGRGPGQFYLPAGAFLDAQGRFYVVDQFNRRIQMFQYLAEPGAQSASESTPDETSTESPPQ